MSPAKNAEVGRAAIDAGADAVYIGGPAFGARKEAGNTIEDIAALVRYARLWHVRVLVTLNTLLHEDEYDEAVRIAYSCKRIGVHALIIQDMRLADVLLRTGDFSGTDGGIRLHASTQCDNRTPEKVQALERMGFWRVVLARELSYREMADIRAVTTCELEAFVHGALCVSYSGRCFLSEAVCGRSANRGECAQMCRLPYDILDDKMQLIAADRHILSLYDLDRSKHLAELLSTGITTLKIEGRLKDADYVRNITAYYHTLLTRLGVPRTSRGRVTLAFEPDPQKTFHRGATEYFSFSRPDNLVNQLTPKSTGELIGYAPLPDRLLAGVQLHNGDGLTYGGEGMYWQPGAKLRAEKGTPVYRNYDAEFHKRLESPDAAVRRLPVCIVFEETADGFRLGMDDGAGTSVSLSFACDKVVADNPVRAEQTLRQQLMKLGDTPLVADSVSVHWTQPLFFRAAFLNDCRRRLAGLFLQTSSPTVQPEQPVSNGSSPTACPQQLVPNGLSPTACPQRLVPNGLSPTACPQQPVSNGSPEQPLMTCKYCILYELGCCRKKPADGRPVPAFLRYRNTILRIVTDCRNCEMQLLPYHS